MSSLAHAGGHRHPGPPMGAQLCSCNSYVMWPRHRADRDDAGKAPSRRLWARGPLFEFQLAACHGVNCVPQKRRSGPGPCGGELIWT